MNIDKLDQRPTAANIETGDRLYCVQIDPFEPQSWEVVVHEIGDMATPMPPEDQCMTIFPLYFIREYLNIHGNSEMFYEASEARELCSSLNNDPLMHGYEGSLKDNYERWNILLAKWEDYEYPHPEVKASDFKPAPDSLQ